MKTIQPKKKELNTIYKAEKQRNERSRPTAPVLKIRSTSGFKVK